MPRAVSAGFLQSVFSQDTEEVFLTLLKIEHADLDEIIYLVNNSEDVVHDGQTYTAFPFEMDLPDETDGSFSRMTILLDNAGLDYVEAFRSISGPADVTMSLVLASDPDVVECGPFRFLSRGAAMSADEIRLELSYEDILNEPFPGDIMSPGSVPGIFA